ARGRRRRRPGRGAGPDGPGRSTVRSVVVRPCLSGRKGLEATMPYAVRGVLAVLGRIMICTIFFMAAVGNKVPNFGAVAKVMAAKGIPASQFMLVGAIVFLI